MGTVSMRHVDLLISFPNPVSKLEKSLRHRADVEFKLLLEREQLWHI